MTDNTQEQIAALVKRMKECLYGIKETDSLLIEAADMLKQLASERAKPENGAPFQNRVAPWMQECFGPEISADRLERGDRLLEEVLELLQSGDYPADRVAALTQYVWSREKGEPSQEVGGVMVTLAAYCLAHGLDMHDAGETELARVWTKVEKIRAKQAAKPTGSALPIALELAPDARTYEDGLEDAAREAEKKAIEHGKNAEIYAEPQRGRDIAMEMACITLSNRIRALKEKHHD